MRAFDRLLGTCFIRCLLGLFLACTSGPCVCLLAQDASDSLRLLKDEATRYAAIEALDSLYDFRFKAARRRMHWLDQTHSEHPLPHLLMALSYWWEIMPDIGDKSHDAAFLAHIDTALLQAEALILSGAKTEGSFFSASLYALRARWRGERGSWLMAAWDGQKALKALLIAGKKKELSVELLLGAGLYNYYSVWLPAHYPHMRMLFSLFKSGEKKKGIRQLKRVARYSFYVRIEALHFLMSILEEEEAIEARRIAAYLHEKYPNNPYFHRSYVKMLFVLGHWVDCKDACHIIRQRLKEKAKGYGGNEGRYASYYLGWIAWKKNKDTETARRYFRQGLHYASLVGAAHKGYTLRSLLHIGDIDKKKGSYASARKHYKKAAQLAKKHNDALHEKALEKLASLSKHKKKR